MADSFTRARSPEQKTERRRQICEAARVVVLRKGGDAATLADFAAEVGISKSAFYRYYKSKEEILAALLLEEAQRVGTALKLAAPGSDSLVEFAPAFADACATHPLFCALAADLASVLERNIEVERLAVIKRQFAAALYEWSEMLRRAGVVDDAATAAAFMRGAYIILAGLWPVTQERPTVAKAKKLAGVEGFGRFEQEYAALLRIHALGLMAS